MTVLLTTFNRADALRETLSSLVSVDVSGIDCDIVVVDNNSTDATPAVVSSFEGCLPISYLRETRTGKNSALNTALRECNLKEIVAFTDDDVTPERDWLQQIVQISRRWPDVAVFGGKIDVQWPGDEQPEWAQAEWIQSFGYSWHDLGGRETFYQAPACPFGPNFWVRRKVFRTVPGFNESLGPRPTNRLMGGETDFLLRLQAAGFETLYSPLAKVKHRISPEQCRISALRRRAYRFGRGQTRLLGWHRQETYQRNKSLWFLVMLADYVYTSCRFLRGLLVPSPRHRCEVTVQAMVRFGCLNETMALFWGRA